MEKPVDGIPDIYLADFTYDAADDLPRRSRLQRRTMESELTRRD
jgi:hypothetical protein